MSKIVKQFFLWFSALTAVAGIYGVFFLLEMPLIMKLMCLALLVFFGYDAITEHKKRKNEGFEG